MDINAIKKTMPSKYDFMHSNNITKLSKCPEKLKANLNKNKIELK